MSKSALHYTKIGDAGGVPLQRCEPSEFGSAHYTKNAAAKKRALTTVARALKRHARRLALQCASVREAHCVQATGRPV